jgi:hypothetical protein
MRCFPETGNYATERQAQMRAVFLWLLGIPIPIIILLYVFHVL